MSERKICSFVSKVRDIFEKICNGKGVRKLVTLISGAVVALVSTAYMLYIDTIVNSQVYYLFGLAIFGLGAGILQVISSNNLAEEEDKFSWAGLSISAFMGIGLILSIGAITSDIAYTDFMASTENSDVDKTIIRIFEVLSIVFAYVNVLIASFAAVLTTREHFVYIHKHGSEKVLNIIDIVKKVLTVSALILVIGAFVSLFLSPVISGSFVEKWSETPYKFQLTTTYSLFGLAPFFGGEIDLNVLVELIERNEMLEPESTQKIITFASSVYVPAIISFVLVTLGSIASLILVLIEKTRKMMFVRIFIGLLGLIGALISLSFGNYLITLSIPHVIEGTTFQIGASLNMFSILTIVASVIQIVVPLIEVEKKAAKIVE